MNATIENQQIPQPAEDWPIIYTYTREQALADGLLIDVSETAMQAGIKFPVAITLAAFADCVTWDATDEERKAGTGQSEAGRLWDVLWMFRAFAQRGGREIRFTLYRVPREGRGTKARLVSLKAICGPGDDAAPVITIMLPNED